MKIRSCLSVLFTKYYLYLETTPILRCQLNTIWIEDKIEIDKKRI
jgi:hypothetical protein